MSVVVGSEVFTYGPQDAPSAVEASTGNGESSDFSFQIVIDATPVDTVEEPFDFTHQTIVDPVDVTQVNLNDEPFDFDITVSDLLNKTPVSAGQHFEQAQYVITSLSQAVQQTVMNKVWDEVAGDYVRWRTEEIDDLGYYYPGPGDFLTQTSHYRIEGLVFTRI